MWADTFDRVIWLPLRELTSRNEKEYDIAKLLEKRFFNFPGDGRLLAQRLHGILTKDRTKTLFILDGMDEVSHLVGRSKLLTSLLNMPRWIVTTRPNTSALSSLSSVDRMVKSIGFTPNEINTYIKAVMPNHKQAIMIQDFISDHSKVSDLASIPIQLDAICYSFQANVIDASTTPTTMTELYILIERALWESDIGRLKKCRPGTTQEISSAAASQMLPSELKRWVQGESNVLQAIAFKGLYNRTVEFDQYYQDQVWENMILLTEFLPKPRPEFEPSSADLRNLAFFRSSGGPTPATSSYHFPHLTFQEYFAAHYFAQHWPDIVLPEVGLTALEFLTKEKYNPVYDIVWRFVAGLLQARGQEEKFFETIVAPPYDVLGPAHARLLLRCFAEMVQSRQTEKNSKIYNELEEHLQQWFLFEAITSVRIKMEQAVHRLSHEPEFPDIVILKILVLLEKIKTNHDDLGAYIEERLKERLRISAEMFVYLTDCIQGKSCGLSKDRAFRILWKHRQKAPPDQFSVVIPLFEYSDHHKDSVPLRDAFGAYPWHLKQADYRDFAAEVLNQARSLTDDAIWQLKSVLMDDSLSVSSRLAVAGCLSRRGEMETEGLDIVFSSWDHISTVGQRAQVETMLSQQFEGSSLPKWIVDKLYSMLGNSDGFAERVLATKLVSPEIFQILVDIIVDPSRSDASRETVVSALTKHHELPRSVIYEVVELLETNGDRADILALATQILGSQQYMFSDEVLGKLSALLIDSRKGLVVLKAFTGQTYLPEYVIKMIQDRLEAWSKDIQRKEEVQLSISIFATQLGKPRNQLIIDEIARSLQQLLQHEDVLVVKNSVRTLGAYLLQSSDSSLLLSRVVMDLLNLINSYDAILTTTVISVLNKYFAVTKNFIFLDEAITYLQKLLGDYDAFHKEYLIYPFGTYLSRSENVRLSKSIVADLIELTKVHPHSSYFSAVGVLTDAPLFDDDIEIIGELLDAADESTRDAAMKILVKQQTIPPAIFRKLLCKSKNYNHVIGSSPLEELIHKDPNSLFEVLPEVLDIVKNSTVAENRRIATEILVRQPTLQDGMYMEIVGMLDGPRSKLLRGGLTESVSNAGLILGAHVELRMGAGLVNSMKLSPDNPAQLLAVGSILKNHPEDMPDSVVQMLVKLLDEWISAPEALVLLFGQEHLSDASLVKVLEVVKHGSPNMRQITHNIEAILSCQKDLSGDRLAKLFVSIDPKHFNTLYGTWLMRSVQEPLSWPTTENESIIQVPAGNLPVSWSRMKEAVVRAREVSGAPSEDFAGVLGPESPNRVTLAKAQSECWKAAAFTRRILGASRPKDAETVKLGKGVLEKPSTGGGRRTSF